MSQLVRYAKPTIIVILIVLTAGLTVACSAGPVSTSVPASSAEEKATIAEVEATEEIETDVEATEEATVTPSSTPTTPASPTPTTPASPTPLPPTPSPIPSPTVVASNDGCVNCHTDKEQLIATADEEEVVESLSEGEG